MARVFTFRRTLVQTRKRGHTATGAACYRLALAAESTFTGTDGAPRFYDFTKRRGIGAAGCELPEGESESWRQPLTWTNRIEKVDYRSNSRQFRDDVIGLPHELIAEGKAEEVVAQYAQRIATKWKTPVHWVIHDLHGKNPHAHVMYAGRSVDGEQFAKHRDREQDQRSDPSRGRQSITELHSQFWVKTLRAAGHEASFEPIAETGNAQDHIGPKAWAREKKAIESEVAKAIAEALDPEQTIDAGDTMRAARAATADLTVTDALALDRDPVTAEMIVARKPIRETVPAVALDAPNVEVRTVALAPPQRSAPPIVRHQAPVVTASPIVALAPPQRSAPPIVRHQAPVVTASPIVALAPPQRSAPPIVRHQAPVVTASPIVALAPPQRSAPPIVRHQAPVITASPIVALAPPQRSAPPIVRHQAPVITASPIVALAPPQRSAAPILEHENPVVTAAQPRWLPIPDHIQEAKRKEQREQAARDRLASAITAATAEAVAAKLIESHAGHASAYASFVGPGIGRRASDAAVNQLRPIVKSFEIAKRDRRETARTDRQYFDAVKRAIDGFRQWWRARGWFEQESRGEKLASEIRTATWPTHWRETEELHADSTRKLAEERKRQRAREQKQRDLAQYRPQLVDTAKAAAKRPGSENSGGYDR